MKLTYTNLNRWFVSKNESVYRRFIDLRTGFAIVFANLAWSASRPGELTYTDCKSGICSSKLPTNRASDSEEAAEQTPKGFRLINENPKCAFLTYAWPCRFY